MFKKPVLPLKKTSSLSTHLKEVTWDQKINPSIEALLPSGIRAFFGIVSERKDCISLGVGEPDFVSPEPVLETAISAIRKGYTHYTANQGLLSLRKTISKYLKDQYDLLYDSEQEILVTLGVSQGIDLALRSIIETNDEVIYASPGYVSYMPLILMNDGVPQKVKLSFSDHFELKIDRVHEKISPRTKAILLNYPSNPIGSTIKKNTLEEIAKLVLTNDLLIISDEIYSELTYEEKHIPIATLDGMKERTLLLGGFSKSFAMTGWRIGYACGPKHWISALLKIHQYSMLCAPTISQFAAKAALEYSLKQRDDMLSKYRKRREMIVSAFNQIGLKCHKPAGSFYIFPSIQSTGLSSIEFATKLLKGKNVAVVPGNAFGEEGEGFIRCSFATSTSDIKKAVERIQSFVKSVL